MPSKVPIEIKMVSWFAQAAPADALRQFATIRAILSDRKVIGKRRELKTAKITKPTS